MRVPGRKRIVVVADLHAFESQGGRAKQPSALHMSGDGRDADRLFAGVKLALQAADLDDVDAVVCPGDLTDRAESGALIQVWNRLDELAKSLDADLIATAGNHDYASHDDSGPVDPKETLMDLNPHFPMGDDETHRDYFAYAVAKTDRDDVRYVSFNSCATHGLSHEGSPEYLHGRVTKSALNRIRKAYSSQPRPGINVLVTHHHPIQLPYFDTEERSQMLDSGLLMKSLEDDAPWLIIHGHKHRPWLHYSHGGADSPVIFSAGSFSADLGGDNFGGSLRNQFYLLEILSEEECDVHGLGLAGTVYAWSRIPYGEHAWVPAGPTDGMAAESGFGWRESPSVIARRIQKWLAEQEGEVTPELLFAWEPKLKYLLPSDLARTIQIIENEGNHLFKIDNHGRFTGVESKVLGASA